MVTVESVIREYEVLVTVTMWSLEAGVLMMQG
jgi:hypothetical protein